MWNIKGVWNVYHPLLETIYGSIILNKDIENLHDNTGYNYNWK